MIFSCIFSTLVATAYAVNFELIRLMFYILVVCVVTTIIVAGIAVPVSKNSVKCDECEGKC